MIKALIVDDEVHCVNALRSLLENYVENVIQIAEANSVDEAIELIRSFKPNLVFLDIHMREKDGFVLANLLDTSIFSIVFTTAYEEYAVEAFRVNALDYLLKPIDVDQLISVCEKATRKLHKNKIENDLKQIVDFVEKNNTVEKIPISNVNGIEYFNVNRIVACVSDGSYTTFHFTNNEVKVASKPILYYEKRLPDNMFMRIHAKYIVNLGKIEIYQPGRGGHVRMENGMVFNVSARRKNQFLKRMDLL